MKIEKIEKSKHKQERILVTLEGKTLLRVTQAELLHFGLYEGLDISETTVVKLKESGQRSETRVQAVNMISSRPFSRRELIKRLEKKGACAEDASAAADYLENLGALNEAEYAAMLVRHYSSAGYGPARLREELSRRGAVREVWDEALSHAPPEEETIRCVLAAKEAPTDEKGKKRLLDFLLRRGFSYRASRAALHDFCAASDEFGDEM